MGDELVVLRKGDDYEREWWWSRISDHEGYVPRNLLGVSANLTANFFISNCRLIDLSLSIAIVVSSDEA